MPPEERYEAYRADITYGTNSEFGFDYLRDNMVMHAEQMVQRAHAYCIVDEVDSILVDEVHRKSFLRKFEASEGSKVGKKQFYAVRTGRVPGIYSTWDECKAQVDGYFGAEYKGFARLSEAEAFVGSEILTAMGT